MVLNYHHFAGPDEITDLDSAHQQLLKSVGEWQTTALLMPESG